MYKDIFTQIGLSTNEAIIYEYLLKQGETSAGEIIKKSTLKRGLVYNTLANLRQKGLVSQRTKDKIAYFSPNHPEQLNEYIHKQENLLKKAKNTFEANMSSIISDFNLISSKPGVKYFEGMEGLKKVLANILTSKETVSSFVDVEVVVKYIEKLNNKHVGEREKIDLHKRVIVTDSSFARDYLKGYHPKITEFKFIDHKLYPIYSIIEIYDGKVAFISLSEKGAISMIVTDENIYKFNKSIFRYIWTRAKTYEELSPFSKQQ